MSEDIQVQGAKHTLVASGDTMTIDGDDVYDLRTVTAVNYAAVRRHVNNAYQGTDFRIQLRQDKRSRMFILATDHREEHLDEHERVWNQLVDRIEGVAVPRLADEFMAAVRNGESVSIGSAGAKVVLSAEGIKKGGLFGKPVPWSQITGTDVDNRTVRVWGSKAPGAEPKVVGQVHVSEWNSRVLPHVVARLIGG